MVHFPEGQTIQLNQRVCMKKLLDPIKIPITITLIRQKINTEWTFGKDKSWSQKRSEKRSEKTKVIFFSRLKLTETTQYESRIGKRHRNKNHCRMSICKGWQHSFFQFFPPYFNIIKLQEFAHWMIEILWQDHCIWIWQKCCHHTKSGKFTRKIWKVDRKRPRSNMFWNTNWIIIWYYKGRRIVEFGF